MARDDQSYAADTFPIERPPPQDPGLMQRVAEWLQLQQQPRRPPVQGPRPPATPVSLNPRDPVLAWADWRSRQVPRPVDWDPMTANVPPELNALIDTGGPVGTGMPGGGLAGWVKLARHSSTGLPKSFRAGPGPPQSHLPPGQTEAAETLGGDLSGKPGGPIHVDYYRGAQNTPHAAREQAVGSSMGASVGGGKEIMDELVNKAHEGGYTGAKFWAIASDPTAASRREAARTGSVGDAYLGNEGRLRLNEFYMGNKAVPVPGGHEIPFPRTLPPKPPWYESEPPITPAQETLIGRIDPERARANWEARLKESEFLRDEMRDLRRQGTDSASIRSLAEAALEAQRQTALPARPAIPPRRWGGGMTSRPVNPGDLAHLAPADQRNLRAIAEDVGHDLGRVPSLDEVAEAAVARGHANSRDEFYARYGPGSPGGPPPTTSAVPGDRPAPRPGMPSQPIGPSPARVEGGQRGAEARREAESAARLEARAQRGHQLTPDQEQLLRRVQERQGGRMAVDETRAQRAAERQAGQQSLFTPQGEPTARARAEPRPRPRGFQPDPAETRRQGYPVEPEGGGYSEGARRGEADELERTPLSTRDRLDREEYVAGRYAASPSDLERMYPDPEARAAAMRVRENRARRRESLNRAESAGREGESLRDRMVRTNREQRGEAPVAPGGAQDLANERAQMLNRAETRARERSPNPGYTLQGVREPSRAPQAPDDAVQVYQQTYGRLPAGPEDLADFISRRYDAARSLLRGE